VLSERELAFIALHKNQYPSVFRFVLRRVNDRELAEELAADVFRVVWQKWDETTSAEIPWLLTIARNVIGNAYRSRERQQALQEKLKLSLESAAGDDENILVDGAMAALREKDRDILQLAYWDELSLADIAAILQCSEAAAKVRLHRARAAFRKLMPARSESSAQKMGA
jgi:RNA polymerase sigma factor (sigma-70 family)